MSKTAPKELLAFTPINNTTIFLFTIEFCSKRRGLIKTVGMAS